jgi:hypothetical protein
MPWLSAFGECKKVVVLVVTGHRNTAAVKFVANCVRRLILGNVQTDDPDRSRALGHCCAKRQDRLNPKRSNTGSG